MMEAIPTLLILLVASVVVFGTASDWCSTDRVSCSGRIVWAIVAGVVSTVVAIAMIVWHKADVDSARRANVPVAILLIIWWAFGVGYLTSSNSPYSELSNGYFASWIAFIASVVYGYLAIAALRGVTFTFGHAAALCLLASIVEFSAATQMCRTQGSCTGRWGWAVAVGVISAVICLVLIAMHYFANEMAEKSAMFFGPLLVLLWAFGAGFNTSADGPFPNPTGHGNIANGYFFTWLSLFSALYYAGHSMPGVREAFRTNAGRAEPAWAGAKSRDVEGVPQAARAGGV